MNRALVFLPLTLAGAFTCSGCSTPQARLTYTKLDSSGADGTGYPFVVPRTVLKVTPTFDKAAGLTGVAFASVPVSIDKNGQPLQAFLATDSSVSSLALTPTTVSSITYVDDLIVSAIGTQVTDNRAAAVSTLVTTASLIAAFAGTVCDEKATFQPFVIDDFSIGAAVPHPPGKSSCYMYTVTPAKSGAVAMKADDVKNIATGTPATWFPIPACKAYTISVARCKTTDCAEQTGNVYSTTVSISDGTQFRKVPLPLKGKVSLHADFCGADVTNDGAGGADWAVAKELVSDIKTATAKK